MAIKPESTI